MSECIPCDVSAGAAVLVKAYCKLTDETCRKISKEFQKGSMTLRELGEKLRADQRFMQFLAKETSLDLSLARAVEIDKKSKKEV